VRRGLLASSLVTYFVKEELPGIFEADELERIMTRIGLDFGHDDTVLWVKQGIGVTSEVTTCSLHTSLAFKMQTKAAPNGVVVGDHILTVSGEVTDLFTPVSKRTKTGSDAFAFHRPDYAQFDFDWETYIRRHNFFNQTPEGRLELKQSSDRIVKPELTKPIAQKVTPYRS